MKSEAVEGNIDKRKACSWKVSDIGLYKDQVVTYVSRQLVVLMMRSQ